MSQVGGSSERLGGAGREIYDDFVRELFEGYLHLLGCDVFRDVNPHCGPEHRLAREGGAFNVAAECFDIGAELVQGLGYIPHNPRPVVADEIQFEDFIACLQRGGAAGLDRDPQASIVEAA